jgi:hypothetical protein
VLAGRAPFDETTMLDDDHAGTGPAPAAGPPREITATSPLGADAPAEVPPAPVREPANA